MKFELANPGLLADALSIISELVTEVKMKFVKESVEIVAIDPANVAMIVLKIPSSFFSSYESEDETIGVNLDDLKQVLRRGREKLTAETKENRLYLDFAGSRGDRVDGGEGKEDEGSGKKNFVLSLLDLETEEKKIPELEFPIKIKMDSSKFSEAVDDTSVITDSVAFNADKSGFIVEAKSSLHSAKINLSNLKYENAKSRYSLEYLQKMVKAARLSPDVTLQFSNDYPLMLSYVTPEKVELSFILAPRVETE